MSLAADPSSRAEQVLRMGRCVELLDDGTLLHGGCCSSARSAPRGLISTRPSATRRIAGSRNLTHHVEANEFFTRLSLEAGAAGGELTEWYGVRTLARLFSSVIVPDGYGLLAMPDSAPLHVLLELDRSTEAARVLRDKTKRYAEIPPNSSLRDLHPFVIFAVPTARRARSVSAAVSNTLAPVSVTVWNRETRHTLLATVTHCAFDARSKAPRSERVNL